MKSRSILDERWRATDLIHHRRNITVPMFNLGGWYDMFAKGEVGNFVYLQNHGRNGARGNHGDLEYPGDIPLGPCSALGFLDSGLTVFAPTLPRPA